MNIRSWGEAPQDRLENKMRETSANKQKAINARVRELERELAEDRPESRDMQNLRSEMEDFRGKMKGLYMSIFQGSKQLSIRKSDLIRQIKGHEADDNQGY